MRLRSSQLVFLLLLGCSVAREDYALRWAVRAVTGTPLRAVPAAEAAVAPARSGLARPVSHAATLHLSEAGLAAHRAAWQVRQPASASAAIASHTGFRRA